MTLSGSLKVLRKLLEPSLSSQLFGASTPEGRFSKDRQFTFFYIIYGVNKKSPGMCGEKEDFGIRGLMVIPVCPLLHTTVISPCTENVPW